MAITRRKLIDAMGRLGGAAAVYQALLAWDLLRAPPAQARPFELPPASGQGRKVAILGAGIAGLCAAYELDRAGYDCIILEASRRAGGRSLTLRRGDSFNEVGDPAQECRFDEGLHLNAGPGRIPHSHVHVIDYCRRFGITLQPYIFASRANLFHTGRVGNGRTMQVRRAYYDLQGHVAELLSKCVANPDLDLPISRADLESFRDTLAQWGDLTRIEQDGVVSYRYENATGRAGYEIMPGVAGDPGRPLGPLALDEILRSEAANYIFRDEVFFWQASMLEPVGGMDHFFRGFLRQRARRGGTIAKLVRFGAKVTSIETSGERVSIGYEERGRARTLNADFAISTIPMPIFKALKTNLPPAFMQAAERLPMSAAGKVAFQAERFWETRDQIYGGISWTTDPISQIWYPSSGFLSKTGVLVGAYYYGAQTVEMNARPVAERIQMAKDQGERLHDGYSKMVEHGLAIGWNRMEFARMSWASEYERSFGGLVQILSQPQGRLYLAGDQMTFWSGWQEGAVLSAHAVVDAIHKQAQATPVRRRV